MTLINAPFMCASLCVGAPSAGECLKARVNDYGQQLCEICGIRLNKVKHHRPHGAGRVCHPQCKPNKRAVDDTGLLLQQRNSLLLRNHAEQSQIQVRIQYYSQQHVLVHIASLHPNHHHPLPNHVGVKPSVDPIDPMALLDAAHARRMALLAAETKITVEFQR